MPRPTRFAAALRRAIQAARKATRPPAVGELGRVAGDGRLRQAWIDANAAALEDATHVDRASQIVRDWLEAAEYPPSTRTRIENQLDNPKFRTAKWLSMLWAAADRMAGNNAPKRSNLLDDLFRRLGTRMMPADLALDDAELRRQEAAHAAETQPYAVEQMEFVGKLVHAGIVTEAEALAFGEDSSGEPTFAEMQRKIADWVDRIRVPLTCPPERPIRVDVHCRTKKSSEKSQLGKGSGTMATTTKKKPTKKPASSSAKPKPALWNVGENPAADAVVFRERANGADVLLVRRKDGRWALPGGFVDKGESRKKAAEREAHEEAGITLAANNYLGQVGRYGGKGTGYDPRDDAKRWVTTEAHAYLVNSRTKIKGGADADAGTIAAQWRPLGEAMALELFAGHRRILADAVSKFLISPCAMDQVAVRSHCRAKPEKLGSLGCPGVADCPCNGAGENAQLGKPGKLGALGCPGLADCPGVANCPGNRVGKNTPLGCPGVAACPCNGAGKTPGPPPEAKPLLGKIDDDPQPLVVDTNGKSLHPGDTVEFRADDTLSGKARGTIAKFKFPKASHHRVTAIVNFKLHGRKIEKIEFKGHPQDEAVGWMIADLVKIEKPKASKPKRDGLGKRALAVLEAVAEFLAESNPIAAMAKLLDGMPKQIPVATDAAKAAQQAALAEIEKTKRAGRGQAALDLANELHGFAEQAFAAGEARDGYAATVGMVGALGACACLDREAAAALAANNFNHTKSSRLAPLNRLGKLAGRVVNA